jgi:hypothetical protein
MAKKVRQKPTETEESRFEFPVFDEAGYVAHELELTAGMALAILWAVIGGVLSAFVGYYASSLGIGGPIAVGFVVVLSSFFAFPTVHDKISTYTRTEWAGVVALEVFGWLGIWFLLAEFLGTP